MKVCATRDCASNPRKAPCAGERKLPGTEIIRSRSTRKRSCRAYAIWQREGCLRIANSRTGSKLKPKSCVAASRQILSSDQGHLVDGKFDVAPDVIGLLRDAVQQASPTAPVCGRPET